jgi:acetyl-CoA C-acetyltransferase
MRDTVIVGAARTPIGSFNGSLSQVPGPRLGAVAIKAALARAGVDPALVGEVYMGTVLPAGVGQAPARQAALFAGLPEHVPCTTVNKVCGSGLKAVMLAAQAIALGDADIVVAGGMENMSLVPYLPARGPQRLPHGPRQGAGRPGARRPVGRLQRLPHGQRRRDLRREMCITREDQDAFAAESYRRSPAIADGRPSSGRSPRWRCRSARATRSWWIRTRSPAAAAPAKLAGLRPAFEKDGTVTAGNASSINDGAAALVLMSAD